MSTPSLFPAEEMAVRPQPESEAVVPGAPRLRTADHRQTQLRAGDLELVADLGR